MPTPTIQMDESQIRQVSVPGVPTTNATIIAAATDRPMRVMIDNSGPVPIRVAFGPSSFSTPIVAGDQYVIPVAGVRIFVLSPKQRLFAGAAGAGGVASVHTSDALPLQL